MKKLLLLAAVPTLSFAIDYSRCPMPMEINVTSEGKVEASQWFNIKSVKTEGRVSTYNLTSKNGTMIFPAEKKVVVTRDDQDRIVSVKVDGDKPSKEVIQQWRSAYGYGGGNSVTIVEDGKTREVALTQIKDSDLADLGVKGIKAQDVRSGVSEWSRSQETQRHIKEIAQKANSQMPYSLFVGTNHQFSYHEGACVPESAARLVYFSGNNSVREIAYYDRMKCQTIDAYMKKHSPKMTECSNYERNEIASDIQKLQEAGAGAIAWGAVGGSFGGGFGGGYAGGYAGGFGAGYAGAGGMGIGGFNQAQVLKNMDYLCKIYGTVPAFDGGSGAISGPGGATGGVSER